MKVSIRSTVALSAVIVFLSAGAISGAARPTQVARPASLPNRDVIVILRDQRPDLPAVREARAARAAALASAQSPIVSHLQASGASRVRGFALINAVAARVSPAEANQLAVHPLVQAVVPDAVIRLPSRMLAKDAGSTGAPPSDGGGGGGGGGQPANGPLCGTLEPEALQAINAAFPDPSTPQAQRLIDGQGNFVTGKGVIVAFIADGLDITLPGYTRPDGTSVFVDYQDFSGDPAGTPTEGGEAFLDSSSIAAQDLMPNGKPLTFDISQYVNAAHPLPSPCNIRILGVAPGASLVGLKVYSQIGSTTTSNFVQAIEYAVNHDNVDIVNESFGGQVFPDNQNDPVSLANDAAVAGGVTVVVSSGDAGPNGTFESPATDPWVISAGATTTFRGYAQIGYGGANFATHGWLDNNISALSSGGISQSGRRTVDVVAPGDENWALCSTNTTQYLECATGFGANPAQPVQLTGGTSESAPLTSATAALVIQSYRSTHHGKDPSPALVKQIIMSTATDLGAPSWEQGAGLVNAYAAVEAALSVSDENGECSGSGTGLLNSPTSASIVDQPHAPETLSFAVTNTGSTHQHLQPTLQALGPAIAGENLTIKFDPAKLPTYPSLGGLARAYYKQQFTVPAGAQHVGVAIAWQAPFYSSSATLLELALVDPNGRNAAWSLPQGTSNGYGQVEVVNPTPGTWTAIISTSNVSATYSGPVQFGWAAERYVTFGSVSPASFDLAPGATQWINARFSMPARPGDSGVAIRFGSPSGGAVSHSEIPIALRTLIPIGPDGGSFSGTLTGGNGRLYTGPTQTFAFNVPQGLNNMSLNLRISDNLYLLEGLLIDPNGMQVSVEPNVDANGNSVNAMQLNRASPQAGQWRFVLLLNYYTSGNKLTLPFTAQIGFNTAEVSAPGLPDGWGAQLSASAGPVTVPITITNDSGLTQAYFADARLNGVTTLQFGTFATCPPESMTCPPVVTTLPYGFWATYLPTQVRSAQFVAQATAPKVPITMDAGNIAGYLFGITGAPDIYSHPIGPGPDTVAASISEPEVPWGEWGMAPSLIGPYGPGGAPSTRVATTVFLELAPFDAAVSSNYGDLWYDVTYGTATFTTGLVLAPGETGTINVTITPNPAQIGTKVRGGIYIDTFNGVVQTGDEVVSLPYSYTIAP